MNRIGVFVDAGYFWVQVAQVVHGSKQARDSVAIDYPILREKLLAEVASQFAGGELLRVYWYDGPGTFSHKAHSHVAIDDLDDFKLRLGTRNTYGDQKAVDGLIIADLVSLAQSRAILSAIVVSGDADLTPGVIAAQGLGMRVHMLSLGPANAIANSTGTTAWCTPLRPRVPQVFANTNRRMPKPMPRCSPTCRWPRLQRRRLRRFRQTK